MSCMVVGNVCLPFGPLPFGLKYIDEESTLSGAIDIVGVPGCLKIWELIRFDTLRSQKGGGRAGGRKSGKGGRERGEESGDGTGSTLA